MDINIFKIIGIIGLLLISIGIITKKRKYQDIYYIFGGLCLLTYSIYLINAIFIVLQSIFISAATYDLIKTKYKK